MVSKICVICGRDFVPRRARTFKCNACVGKPFAAGVGMKGTRYCANCGKLFEVKENRFYCSDKCEAAPPKRVDGLSDIARMANNEHMTYGAYVAKYGL